MGRLAKLEQVEFQPHWKLSTTSPKSQVEPRLGRRFSRPRALATAAIIRPSIPEALPFQSAPNGYSSSYGDDCAQIKLAPANRVPNAQEASSSVAAVPALRSSSRSLTRGCGGREGCLRAKYRTVRSASSNSGAASPADSHALLAPWVQAPGVGGTAEPGNELRG